MLKLIRLTTLAILLSTALTAQFPDSGLVVHYPLRMDGKDASGHGHHLTNKEVLFQPGGVRGLLDTHAYFSGQQACFYYNKSAHSNTFNLQNFTISLWARLDGMPNLYGNLFEFGETVFLRFFRPNDGGPWRLQGGYRHGTGLDWITHDFMYNTSGLFQSWHHYVLSSSFENGLNIMRLYRDGWLVSTEVELNHPFILYTFADSLLHIGGRPGIQALNLHGGIQDVFYYNRVLSGEEVLQLYNYTLEGPTSIHENHQAHPTAVFPNPTQDQLFLELKTEAPWRILDLLGRECQHGLFQPGMPIPVRDLAPGTYILEINGEAHRFVRE